MLELIDLIIKNNCKKVAEIGVYKGRTMRSMLRDKHVFNIVEEYWAIDPYKPMPHYFTRQGKHNAEEWNELYKKVSSYMAWFPQLKLIKLTSEEAGNLFPKKYFSDGYFDLVFIDAEHTYEKVKQDIEVWLPLVKENRILCGHDYNNKYHPGVKQAVDEVFGEANIKLLGNSIWVKK